MSINFRGSNRDEVQILRSELNSNKLEVRRKAVKKVIAAMTVGKDVSMLFTHVLKCVETEDLELKKLVYLYIINYSKAQPDLALMAINTFRKDSTERVNPLVRSLAVRTMGCIGIEEMLEYLLGPLGDAMNDEDAYVRKTAAMCVAKVYEINPEKIETLGLLDRLKEMLFDGNGMVVSNAIAAVSEISQTKGQFVPMTAELMNQLLTALPECSEWGRVYILDFMAETMSVADTEESFVTRIIPNLAHSNPALVLSAAKVVLKFLDGIDETTDRGRSICRKLAPPLISLMNNAPEIQYVAARNINLILMKHPQIFEREVRVFFCNFQDPLYVKLAKLELMVRLADLTNVDQLLTELKDYAQEVDITFARKAISAVGIIAVKVEQAAERCVLALQELIRTKVAAQYVIEEIVIVIKDIFRQYPNRYESIIRDLCYHLRSLDNADARASMVWIIGEYGQRIDNSVQLITHFSEGFKDEAKTVQMAILTAAVKLYLKLEDEAEDLVTEVLKMATDESDNPDLRNRGYIYWRMLSMDPQTAKQIILCEKPPMHEQSNNLDSKVRDNLLGTMSMLSSVFYKTPEQFVKKIRDRINERLDLEKEEEVDLVGGAVPQEYIDSTGLKRSDYLQEAQTEDYLAYAGGNQGNLLDLDDGANVPAQTNLDDILGTGSSTNAGSASGSANEGSLLDILDGPAVATSQAQQQPSGLDLLDEMAIGASPTNQVVNTTFVKTPFKQVVPKTQIGNQKQMAGIEIHASMMRLSQDSSRCLIKFKITNHTVEIIRDFLFKLNVNYFGYQVEQGVPQTLVVAPGTTVETQAVCTVTGTLTGEPPQRPPILIQGGMMSSLDLFFFELPVLAQVLFEKTSQNGQAASLLLDDWNNKPHQQAWTYEIPKMSSQCGNPQLLKQRLERNNIHMPEGRQGTNQQGIPCFLAYVETQLPQRDIVGCEISINPSQGNKVSVKCWSETTFLVPLVIQAVSFVLGAEE